MGGAKSLLLEGPAIHANGHFVCAGCFEDYAIKAFIRANALAESCDFCDSTQEPVASLRLVVDRIDHGLSLVYADAADVLSYCGAEGGYQGEHFDTADLLSEDVNLELPNDG